MRRAAAILGLLTLAGACTASDAEGPDLDGVGGKEDRNGAPAFVEVDADHSSAAFRRYIGGALELLRTDDSRIAKLTYASIRDGRVRIDELSDMTCWDFERARKEIAPDELKSSDWVHLQEPQNDATKVLSEDIDGYMWSNRVYVARGLRAKRLAATLVHEVNHVINRSEVGYFDDLPTSAFLHEYRSFYAERLFDPDTYRGVNLVDHVIELYELDGSKIPESIRAKPLTPRLYPDDEAWQLRHAEDDQPDREEDCPGLK